MIDKTATDLQLLRGILGNWTGTLQGFVICKNGVIYAKKEVNKKERLPIERKPTR